jgi:hypothetical protein
MNIKWRLQPDGKGGFVGSIEIPLNPGAVNGGGRVVAMAKGGDKATALGKAAVIAKQITENPIVAALMPPQAAVAVKAISALSKSAAVGKLAEAASKFTGPAMKRLSNVLGL